MSEASPYEPGALKECEGRAGFDPSNISAVCIQLALGLPVLAVGLAITAAILRGAALLLRIPIW